MVAHQRPALDAAHVDGLEPPVLRGRGFVFYVLPRDQVGFLDVRRRFQVVSVHKELLAVLADDEAVLLLLVVPLDAPLVPGVVLSGHGFSRGVLVVAVPGGGVCFCFPPAGLHHGRHAPVAVNMRWCRS